MADVLYVRIPQERIGVLIGPGGETKRLIEQETGVKILIDSETGEVTVDESAEPAPEPPEVAFMRISGTSSWVFDATAGTSATA